MPTYEYACTSCGNEWELEQSIKDDAIKECPKCHQGTAKRQISRGTGFILKGGGWYSDLYSGSSNKGGGSSSGGDSGSSASSSSTTTGASATGASAATATTAAAAPSAPPAKPAASS
jgi:putative FmdB family regulatory protein